MVERIDIMHIQNIMVWLFSIIIVIPSISYKSLSRWFYLVSFLERFYGDGVYRVVLRVFIDFFTALCVHTSPPFVLDQFLRSDHTVPHQFLSWLVLLYELRFLKICHRITKIRWSKYVVSPNPKRERDLRSHMVAPARAAPAATSGSSSSAHPPWHRQRRLDGRPPDVPQTVPPATASGAPPPQLRKVGEQSNESREILPKNANCSVSKHRLAKGIPMRKLNLMVLFNLVHQITNALIYKQSSTRRNSILPSGYFTANNIQE
jgi:hypothetical protein